MKRIVTAVVTALEALAIVLAGIGIIAVPVLLVWLFSYGLAGDPSQVFGLILSLWFFGHGSSLTVALDSSAALALGLPAVAVSAVFSLVPLGFTLFTAGLSARIGARMAAMKPSDAAWGAAAGGITFFLLSLLLSTVAPRPPVGFSIFHAAIMPALVSAVGIGLGYLVRSIQDDAAWFVALKEWGFSRIPSNYEWMWPAGLMGLRIAGVALLGLVAASSLVFTVNLIAHYVDVISLSQQLHVDVIGTIVLFLVNLAYLPTMLIWTLSWIVGPGFSLGIGASISPVAVVVGPVPGIPVLGAIPSSVNGFSLAIVLLVIASGALASAAVLRSHRAAGGDRPNLKVMTVYALKASVAVGIVVWLLMTLAVGSIGPDRLSVVGPHPWPVAGFSALEIFAGVALGSWLSFVDWNRVGEVVREKSPLSMNPLIRPRGQQSSSQNPDSASESTFEVRSAAELDSVEQKYEWE